MEHKIKVTVIGGANADICGASFNTPVASDSNPGRVTISSGGVGRNIAHNLCLLGAEVDFISAFGGGELSHSLAEECRKLGMKLDGSVFNEAMSCSTYLCVNDEKGELIIAVNDMEILNALTPGVIGKQLNGMNSADAVVIDTNLSPEAVEYICSKCGAPLYCDTVSSIKAPRIEPFLDRLHVLKANRAEASLLTGEDDPVKAAAALCARGVKHSFVSCGADGIVFCSVGTSPQQVSAVSTGIVNTSGAGDSAMAAIVFSLSLGLSAEDAAKYAMKAAAVTCGSMSAVSPEISRLFASF